MKVLLFLDSNIFFDKWHLTDPNFRLITNYIKNSDSQIIISDLVCEEVDNLYLQKWSETLQKTRKHLKELSDLSSSSIECSINDIPSPYSLKSLLNEKLGYSNIMFIAYHDIPQKDVTYRAIHRIRPFQDDDKGYRDTLIWLSLLNFLKNRNLANVKEISFVSKNKSDFYDNNKNLPTPEELRFFPSLQDEINKIALTVPIKAYINLSSFISGNVPTEQHEFSYVDFAEKFIYPNEREIESKVAEVINSLSPIALERTINNWHHNYEVA